MRLNTFFPHLMFLFCYISHVALREYGLCYLTFIPQLLVSQEDYCLKIPKHSDQGNYQM